ncbi:MAG: hypothetical protein HC898_13000, partial [Phycisphaerales bacterium]|nr:hypothetical protein [Phycisphaerales bacterium]
MIRDAYPRQNRRGFVLLMALVLVLIAGVALAGIAAQSMFSALNSQSEVEELQRRWAILSLRKTLAGRVADTLAKAEGADQGSQRGGNNSAGDVVAIKEWRTNLNLA